MVKMKTLKINEETHKELTKMKGELMATTGKPNLTYDEVILELIRKAKKE
jgi:predicted CopG family antitoxin